jgi:hypothetical protein
LLLAASGAVSCVAAAGPAAAAAAWLLEAASWVATLLELWCVPSLEASVMAVRLWLGMRKPWTRRSCAHACQVQQLTAVQCQEVRPQHKRQKALEHEEGELHRLGHIVR